MSKISQDEIAELLGETRPAIKKFMADPESIPIGIYKKLQALGINIETQEWNIVTCELCNGKGFRLERSKS